MREGGHLGVSHVGLSRVGALDELPLEAGVNGPLRGGGRQKPDGRNLKRPAPAADPRRQSRWREGMEGGRQAAGRRALQKRFGRGKPEAPTISPIMWTSAIPRPRRGAALRGRERGRGGHVGGSASAAAAGDAAEGAPVGEERTRQGEVSGGGDECAVPYLNEGKGGERGERGGKPKGKASFFYSSRPLPALSNF